MATEPQQPVYYDPPNAPFATQRSELRAEVGRIVGTKLDSTPRVWRLGSSSERPVQLYIREDFLSVDECRQLCELIDAGVYPSPLYEKDKYEGVRTSHSCNLDVHDPFVADIETRIAAMLGLNRTFGEPLQGQRYEVGQEFKPHSDFFYVDQPYWAEYEPHGGQRTWTAMIYLNEPESGGATGFTYLDLNIMPRLGRILIWNNMAADGSPNPWTAHCGYPVESGIKYVVTKWYRERTFV
jgi:prolyl 4-hydroxylase